jgi:hypothetical protein
MLLPLLLSDRGDISVFETVRDLERYVESPDAFEYKIYDASGQRFFFKGDRPASKGVAFISKWRSMRLDIENPGLHEGDELSKVLRAYLQRVGYSDPIEPGSLQHLVLKTIELTGFTR